MIKNSVLNKSMINKSTTKMQPPPEQPPQQPPEQPPQEPPEQPPPQGPHPPFQEEVTDRMIDRHFCFFARDPLDRNSDLMIWNSFAIAILSIDRTPGPELLAGARAEVSGAYIPTPDRLGPSEGPSRETAGDPAHARPHIEHS